MDCHQIMAAIGHGEPLSERTLRSVCNKLIEVLVEESNLLIVDGPINVIGDVHGQFYDLQKIFKLGN